MEKEINWLLKEKYNNKPSKKFLKDVKRLTGGEPLDYVIGFTNFGVPPGSCKIDLSKKPLIPRPETEFWVQQAVKDILKNSSLPGCYVLDMFAGSGCVGLAILKNIKNAKVDFSDKEVEAIAQIKINLKLNKINKKRYKIIKSDVFLNIKNKYDFIFANPPYIPTKNRNKIQKSVLKYEPKNALFGGGDGLFYINKFVKQAKNYLNTGGKIYMEFDPPQKNKIEKILKKYKYKNWEFYKDQYGKYRWVMVK